MSIHQIEQYIDKFWVAVITSLFGGVTWLIRRIFTNQRQIELLEAEVKRRSDDIKEIKADVKQLIRKVGE